MAIVEAGISTHFWDKTCIIVKRGNTYHVRNYKRILKNGKGMAHLIAIYKCTVKEIPLIYPKLFKV